MYTLSIDLKAALNKRLYRSTIKKNQNLFNEVLTLVNWTDDIDEAITAVKNNIMSQPLCPVCSKILKLKNQKGTFKYSKGCSISHAQIASNLKKYGVKNVFQLQTTKDKSKITCLKKYGVEHSLQNDDIREKGKKTLIKKYGVDNAFKAEQVKKKIKITMIKKYGVSHPMYSTEIKITMKHNWFKKYGVDNPSKNKKVFQKIINSRKLYTHKQYTFPSGKTVSVMGYEPQAIDKLLKIYDESEVVVETDKIPTIDYVGEDNQPHTYFPDIYIPKRNLLIEVKSVYTYEKELSKNLLKQKATLDSGYNFKFMIMDS